MPKLSRQDQRILEALEIYESAADVAAETGAPFRRVIYLQRLYGPVGCQESRRWDDQQSAYLAAEIRAEQYSAAGPHPLAVKLATPYGPYWRQLEGMDRGRDSEGEGRGAA